MTDLAGAHADTSKLPTYEGRDVLRTSIKVRNAGDGLSKAVKIDPEVHGIHTRRYVVLECTVEGHDFKPIDGTDALELIQEFKAGAATILDSEVVKEAIEAQKMKIEVAEERAKGERTLADADEEDDEVAVLRRQHFSGVHNDEPRHDCPLCAEAANGAAEVT